MSNMDKVSKVGIVMGSDSDMPVMAKAAVAAIGFGENYVRLPLTTMEPENEAKMRALMREQGFNV